MSTLHNYSGLEDMMLRTMPTERIALVGVGKIVTKTDQGEMYSNVDHTLLALSPSFVKVLSGL